MPRVTAIEPIYANIGQRIQRIRESRGMTQELLGKSLAPPLTRASVANIESGKQRLLLHTFLQVSGVLDVPFHDLIPDTGPKKEGTDKPADLERQLAKELDVPRRVLKRLASKFVKAERQNP